MFKYIKEHAAQIDGISIYPIISLLIFFLFFVVLLIYVTKLDKKKVEAIRQLPLDLPGEAVDSHSQTPLKHASV